MRVIQQAAQTVPSLFLYVQGQPGTYPPAAHPYLQGMSDPSETETFTMLSFYRFSEITDPVSMAEQLQLLWKPFKALGETISYEISYSIFLFFRFHFVPLHCSIHLTICVKSTR